VPSGHIELCQVTVPAAVSDLSAATFTDRRTRLGIPSEVLSDRPMTIAASSGSQTSYTRTVNLQLELDGNTHDPGGIVGMIGTLYDANMAEVDSGDYGLNVGASGTAQSAVDQARFYFFTTSDGAAVLEVESKNSTGATLWLKLELVGVLGAPTVTQVTIT